MPLRHAMTLPVVCRCPDCHYCRVIFDLAAFIADYPEQVYVRGPPVGSHLYGLSYSIFTSSSTSILEPFILNPHISHFLVVA